MYKFLLKPKWIAFHLLCLATIVAMINLALWQLRRLDEKRTFNDRVTSHTDADVVPLSKALLTGDLNDLIYRRVEVTGSYLPDHDFTVVGVSQEGSNGVDAVGAIQLADGSVAIVNRGFVADGSAVPAEPTGTVHLVGRLKISQVPGTGEPSDDGSQQLTQIRRVDLHALSQQFDQPVLPMYVELLQSDPAEPASVKVIPFPTLDEGPHLSYTVQWIIFSICVAVGWVFAVRKSIRTRAGVTKPKKRRPPPILDPHP